MDRQVLAKYRIGKAEECLSSADALIEMEDYLAVLNRSYYAIFHAVRATLTLDGVDREKHSGVISFFYRIMLKLEYLIKNTPVSLRKRSRFGRNQTTKIFMLFKKRNSCPLRS